MTLAEVRIKCTGIADGDDELVDAGDLLFGIDEEPFPVEGYDLNFERGWS